MAKFEPAIKVVLKHEKGYSNNPRDKGGETNWGISKRSYPNVDIKNLTLKDAKDIYFRDFWIPVRCGIFDNQLIATKIFDISVNMGKARAIRLLQKSVNAVFRSKKLKVDGKIGYKTLKAANDAVPIELLIEIRAQQAIRYTEIILRDPSQKVFLKGWMRRAVS